MTSTDTPQPSCMCYYPVGDPDTGNVRIAASTCLVPGHRPSASVESIMAPVRSALATHAFRAEHIARIVAAVRELEALVFVANAAVDIVTAERDDLSQRVIRLELAKEDWKTVAQANADTLLALAPLAALADEARRICDGYADYTRRWHGWLARYDALNA